MPHIAIQISIPTGTYLLVASSEREIALMTESVLNQVARETLPVSVWVECADLAVTQRLASDLAGVQSERIADEVG